MNLIGAMLGLVCGLGLWLAATRVFALLARDPRPRVTPYLRDLPPYRDRPHHPGQAGGLAAASWLLAAAIDATMGGPDSVRRRLRRAGLPSGVGEFRSQQISWGLTAFGVTAAVGMTRAAVRPNVGVGWLMLALLAFALGVAACDYRLSRLVHSRERRMVEEFPTVAELLALAVAAGEGPVAALDRVVSRTGGELNRELGGVLARIRTGTPVGVAFDELAAVTGVSVLARFAQAVAVAVERGTPLAEVLHAQAADVREAGRRELIEVAARKEIAMMVPVVFLVLPITVIFALWPGVLGLSLGL